MYKYFLLVFLISMGVEASLMKQIRDYQISQVLKKACDIEVKEGLLPIQCSKTKAYSQSHLKLLCLRAVNTITQFQQLEKEKQDLQRLDPYCLQKIETKKRDLVYKQRKAELWTTQDEHSQ